MSNSKQVAVLDRILDPISQTFSPETANALLTLRADEKAQARVAELADKCSEGTLTPDEAAEYDAYITAGTLVGILQAKARKYLRSSTPVDPAMQ